MLEPKQAQFETTESKPAEFTEENKAQQSDHLVDQALGIFKDLRALEVTPTSQVAAHEILSAISVRRPRALIVSAADTASMGSALLRLCFSRMYRRL